MSVVPSYILFCARRETRRHLCHKPKTRYVLTDYGWSPAVSRIKTIYRNYRRARFIEFDRTVPLPSLPIPRALLFFRRWQRSLIRSEKPSIRTCVHGVWYIYCPISSILPPPSPSPRVFLPLFSSPLFFSRPARRPDVE